MDTGVSDKCRATVCYRRTAEVEGVALHLERNRTVAKAFETPIWCFQRACSKAEGSPSCQYLRQSVRGNFTGRFEDTTIIKFSHRPTPSRRLDSYGTHMIYSFNPSDSCGP